MDDRTLLRMAAKAEGRSLHHWFELGQCYMYDEGGDPVGGWNPLEDDGDALRLAVKLRLGLHFESQSFPTGEDIHIREDVEIVEVFGPANEDGSCHCEAHSFDGDPLATTRRAIVRAAAEIALSKEKSDAQG